MERHMTMFALNRLSNLRVLPNHHGASSCRDLFPVIKIDIVGISRALALDSCQTRLRLPISRVTFEELVRRSCRDSFRQKFPTSIHRIRNFIYPHSNSPLAFFEKGIAATALLNASDMSVGAIFLVR